MYVVDDFTNDQPRGWLGDMGIESASTATLCLGDSRSGDTIQYCNWTVGRGRGMVMYVERKGDVNANRSMFSVCFLGLLDLGVMCNCVEQMGWGGGRDGGRLWILVRRRLLLQRKTGVSRWVSL